MRIFFVTNNYTPYSGGVVSSINAVVSGLQAAGHDVRIITLNFLRDAHNDPEYVIRLPSLFHFTYKQNHMAFPWRPTTALYKLCVQYKPDIIHVHHPFLLGVSGLKVARVLHIPCVFTYHTVYEDYAHYVPLLGRLSKPIINFLVTKFCKSVSGIIAPSSAIKNSLLSRGITKPIAIIPSPLRAQFCEKNDHLLSTPEKPWFDLLVVSRFVPEKNIGAVFSIFMLLPPFVRLTLAGYGIEYEALQEHAFKTLQLSPERVRFIHKPAQDVLVELYRSADLFIFTSQTDTQGLVMAEAMSQGLPVIAFDGPGQRDIIRNGENGFIVKDAAQAALAITNCINNPALHIYLRVGAKKTAVNYHSDHLSQLIIQLYNQVLLKNNHLP
jgi:1,2-diacylglycerol 3-alpha-glucosyltransferase